MTGFFLHFYTRIQKKYVREYKEILIATKSMVESKHKSSLKFLTDVVRFQHVNKSGMPFMTVWGMSDDFIVITQWQNGSNELWTWSGQGLRTKSNAIYKRLKNISAVKLSTTTRLLLLLQNAANTQSIEYKLMVLFETLACQTYQKFVRFARGCWGWGAVSTIIAYVITKRDVFLLATLR